MDTQSDQTEQSFDWIRVALVVLLIIGILGILITSTGVFDPKPLGHTVAIYSLTPVELVSDEPNVTWLKEPIISEKLTIRLNAALREGSLDSGYGVALGNNRESVVIAVSPTGYLAIQRWQEVNGSEPDVTSILPWQVWPHVGRNDEMNEIWIDVEAGKITGIRINREILWEEAIPVTGTEIGLFAQGFEDAATIDFQSLEYFSEE